MAVKLLLIEDVEDFGRSGDIVNVRPGHARNYLLPQGFAVLADKRALRMQARLQEERKKKALVDKQESDEMAARLEGNTLSTIVKVDHDGHMYGSVNTHEIAELIQAQLNVAVEKKSVQLKHALKETGIYTISLKLKEGVTATLKLKVIPEGGTLEEPVEAEAAAAQPEPKAEKKSPGKRKKAESTDEEESTK